MQIPCFRSQFGQSFSQLTDLQDLCVYVYVCVCCTTVMYHPSLCMLDENISNTLIFMIVP